MTLSKFTSSASSAGRSSEANRFSRRSDVNYRKQLSSDIPWKFKCDPKILNLMVLKKELIRSFWRLLEVLVTFMVFCCVAGQDVLC